MENVRLTLYVVGNNNKADKAIANLRKLCEQQLGKDYTLTIVNVIEEPDKAERAKILATPTLIRESPLPARRLIGDMSNINCLKQFVFT